MASLAVATAVAAVGFVMVVSDRLGGSGLAAVAGVAGAAATAAVLVRLRWFPQWARHGTGGGLAALAAASTWTVASIGLGLVAVGIGASGRRAWSAATAAERAGAVGVGAVAAAATWFLAERVAAGLPLLLGALGVTIVTAAWPDEVTDE